METYKYTKGSKWLAINDSSLGWYAKGDVVTATISHNHFLTIKTTRGTFTVTDDNFIPYVEPVVDPVVAAKLAYFKAKDAYEDAVNKKEQADREAERKAAKFTEDDIKNLMVVRLDSFFNTKDNCFLRLVTFNREGVLLTSPDGSGARSCKRDKLLNILNSEYKKTTKTLKDFANAI